MTLQLFPEYHNDTAFLYARRPANEEIQKENGANPATDHRRGHGKRPYAGGDHGQR
jgi:hypothetical protein